MPFHVSSRRRMIRAPWEVEMRNSAVNRFAFFRNQRIRSIIEKVSLIVLLSSLLGHVAAQAPSGSDQKVEDKFYSAKDRLLAIQKATVFNPKAVSEADIMQGPPQEKNQ